MNTPINPFQQAMAEGRAQIGLWSTLADAYAVEQADGRALASALLKLHEDNASTLTPDPVYARWTYSHPPALERLGAIHAKLSPA